MSSRRTFPLQRRFAFTALAAALAGPAAAENGLGLMSRDPRDSVRVSDQSLARPLRRAVQGADAWLEKPACQELFTDFRDQRGAPLASVLKQRGRDPREQLRSIFFYDGAHHPVCRAGGSAAVSSPGSAVIFVCPLFGDYSRDVNQARAVVVHELLHTLGLGENPPTSLQITNRVIERCIR